MYSVRGLRKVDSNHVLSYSSEDKRICVWDVKKAKLSF